MKKYDVIIIGSGLGGLECAYILARRGMSVLVLEQAAHPGGCMQSYQRGGMDFDTGFHYVGGLAEGQSMYDIFKYMGLMELPWQRLDADGFDRVHLCGRNFRFPEGFDEFERYMSYCFPRQKKALHDYVELLRMTARQEREMLRTRQYDKDWFADMAGRGAWEYLSNFIDNPLLVNILSGASLKTELHRDTLPLFSFLHANSSYIESSWRLKGGSGQIVDTLCRGIRSQGGEIICRAKATRLIELGGNISQVVCSDGNTHEAKFFISAIHPAHTVALLPDSLSGGKSPSQTLSRYSRRISSLGNTGGMFTVSLRMKPETLRYFNWNQYVYAIKDVWSSPMYDPDVRRMLISCRVPEDDSGYARQVDLLTPSCWSDWQAWQDKTSRHGDEEYQNMKDVMAMQCIKMFRHSLKNDLGQPELACNLSDCIESWHTSTPLTWHDYTLTPQGSAYGIRKDWHSPLTTFLSPRTPIPNLLMTGQNLALHGVHGVTMTAVMTCGEVFKGVKELRS